VLVLISPFLVLFISNCRRNNRRSQALYTTSVPSPDVVNPFTQAVPYSNPTWNPTFLSQDYTSSGQLLPSHPITSKFTQRGQPSGGISHLTPLQPAFMSPSSSSPPLNGLQTSNLDGTRTGVPQTAMAPLMQQSPSPREARTRFSLHEDMGVRVIPSAEKDDLDRELVPPFQPVFMLPSSSRPPLNGLQTRYLDGTRTRTGVPQTEAAPLMQQSPSPREARARFSLHEDMGVRVAPSADGNESLPPLYSF